MGNLEAQDPIEEINLTKEGEKTRPAFISSLLEPMKELKYCSAWDYKEMLDLDRGLVEHRLPLKPGKKPVK